MQLDHTKEVKKKDVSMNENNGFMRKRNKKKKYFELLQSRKKRQRMKLETKDEIKQ